MVIDSEGGQLGVMDRDNAIRIAKEQDLDLIEVAPNADPPVAKIYSFSKYKYQQEKKRKENKTRPVEQKEMWFKAFIGEGDFSHKIERIKEFLVKKHSVKITVKGKGRVNYAQLKGLLDKVILVLGDNITEVTEFPKMEGRNLSLLLRPNKNKKSNLDIKDQKPNENEKQNT
jgi:translation initiation factor IF-3